MVSKVPKRRLGIDLGGSKIMAVVIDPDGKVIAKAKTRTKPQKGGYEGVLERIRETAESALDKADCKLGKDIKAFGVGIPGPVLSAKGIVSKATNLGWGEKPVAKDLSEQFKDLPVAIGNDVNFGALGEYSHGAAAGVDSAYALFMGTGLGGAAVIDDKVVEGANGFAGELGHLPFPGSSRQCSCGQIGCLETVAAKVGIKQHIHEALAAGETCLLEDPDDLRSSKLRKAWDDGCPTVHAALEAAARALAWGIQCATLSVDPEAIVLGGGVLEELSEELLPVIQQELDDRYGYFVSQAKHDLRVATLGDFSVATGAAVAGGRLV
jgi:glucokinase